ncbi:hypothetical protein [Sphingobacterium olei]|uniref:hypothetical protein n=1 Tax=Sphingobacterium olei TaxID=2571155 RepID=UPI00138FD3CE|nr:hypothetical protein [Sphingobacterium olei]
MFDKSKVEHESGDAGGQISEVYRRFWAMRKGVPRRRGKFRLFLGVSGFLLIFGFLVVCALFLVPNG